MLRLLVRHAVRGLSSLPPVSHTLQCSVCGNLNDATQANQLGHIVCGGCAVTLAYAFGAQARQRMGSHRLCFMVLSANYSSHVPAAWFKLTICSLFCAACRLNVPCPPPAAAPVQSVKCSVCGFVTPATEQSSGSLAGQQARPPMPVPLQQAGGADAPQQAGTQQASTATGNKPNSSTVLVVNPGDEGGNDVSAVTEPLMRLTRGLFEGFMPSLIVGCVGMLLRTVHCAATCRGQTCRLAFLAVANECCLIASTASKCVRPAACTFAAAE